MKKRMAMVIIGFAVAVMLSMAMATPAMAAGESVVATVKVNMMISSTVRDNGAAGLIFGTLNPGSTHNAELAQGGNGAVTLGLGIETNIDCVVGTKADDFISGSYILPIGNAKCDTDNDVDGARTMTRDYTGITTLSRGSSQDVWHWLSVPTGQEPGIYTTAFYYQVQEVTSEA